MEVLITRGQGMQNGALEQLAMLGQSVWLDEIGRELVGGGALERLIAEVELRGLTSNPSIYAKAIADGHGYAAAIKALKPRSTGPKETYERLSLEDLRLAADHFRGLYDRSGGRDGFVSLEVDPRLAYDTVGTLAEARRLWAQLDRPNAFIKVPATDQGLPAIQALLGEGINVNATLLFGVARYRQVAEAFLAGAELRAASGRDLRHLASVASLFVSRIDAWADPRLDQIRAAGGPLAEGAKALRGWVGISSAKLAYQAFRELFGSERFRALEKSGARAQRLVWASMGAKDPAFSDVKYVDELVGAGTICTLPMATLLAFRDHGSPKAWLEKDIEECHWDMDQLEKMGVSIEAMAVQLEKEGVDGFQRSFERILAALA